MATTSERQHRIGIAGLGTIGKALAQALHQGVPGAALAAVSTRNQQAARDWLQQAGIAAEVVPLHALAQHCDIVVECAPAAIFGDIARPVLEAGKQLIVLSSGALLDHPDVIDLAARTGGRILVPTGALLGLDALNAAAQGTIHSVTMVTRKPVKGLLGAPYLAEHGIEIEGITEPLRIFAGSAREAIAGFPANVNVAVGLSLAGIGPDRTTMEIWADPGVTRNTHTITVDSDSAALSMTIENIPSENPKTGRITARSAVALLRKMSAPLAIGT